MSLLLLLVPVLRLPLLLSPLWPPPVRIALLPVSAPAFLLMGRLARLLNGRTSAGALTSKGPHVLLVVFVSLPLLALSLELLLLLRQPEVLLLPLLLPLVVLSSLPLLLVLLL